VGLRSFTLARDELLKADRAGLSSVELCETIVKSFHQVARFGWCAVMTTDADTHLPSGGVVEGFSPNDCVPFWDNELLDPDFNKFSDLAQRNDPIATLYQTVDGHLFRSPRFANVYVHLGAGDEMRMAFVAGTSCLAVGVFVRRESDGPFTLDEISNVRQLMPVVTGALRRALSRGIEEATTGFRVVILLDAANGIVGITPGGWEVLDDLRTEPIDGEIPGLIAAAAAKARGARTTMHVTTRLRNKKGRWLRMDASPIEGQPGMVALTIAPARADDLSKVLLDAYGLTARETDVALCICRGLATKDIANELAISAHTVRDHIKTVFAKAGVGTRGELMALLLTNHMFERFHANTVHMRNGSVVSKGLSH
jgi:DNA-binding CsgD family transcriptional regulator